MNSSFRDLVVHKYLSRPYKLHTVDHGGHGPVIIFLHGLASSSANWDELIPHLTDEFRCISIELIGFGDSPKPQWYRYTIEDHLSNIHAAVRSLKLKDPFILVGHSLGSLLATRYSRDHPKRISHLLLLSPPIYAPLEDITSRSARQRTSLYLRAYKFIRTHPKVTPDNILRLTRILPQMKFLILNRATWIPFVRSLEQCIENQTLLDDIRSVRAPIDIFYGIFDEVIVPYNIRQTAKIQAVTIHPLRVNHIVGKRYAATVARVIKANTTPNM